MTDTPSWHRVKEILEAALARPPAERAGCVETMCGDDASLRQEVESLLAATEQAGDFIERPALQSLSATAAFSNGRIPDLSGRALDPGESLGPYTILEFIGAGGMGEVYRARDSNLNRDVALKVRPATVALDEDRFTRFTREAQILATLNHPNISAIYGLESSGGVQALVLELVEGPTLASRIARGRVPISEALTIARQIADGLEAAHQRGIIHRDLKPANVKLRPDGTVKILDFGLAKALDAVDAGSVTSNEALATSITVSHVGLIFGTAAYMSPEQARGDVVDKRADIWAFGCVLFEMLTGVVPFGGDRVADVLEHIITSEPDVNALPADTPTRLRICVQRCLHKDVRQRFHDIADVRLALEGAFDAAAGDARPRGRSRLAYAGWGAAAVVAIAAGSGIVPSVNRSRQDTAETRLDIVTPPTSSPASLAISPDGRSVVFSGIAGEPLLLRRLDSHEPHALIGTEDGTMPFWSPDSRSIGFFAQGVLKRIDLAGGFVRTLANAPQPRQGTWNHGGTIVFGAGSIGSLQRVPADGGAVQPATSLLPGQTNHRWPQFLPDGRRFLLFSLGVEDVRGVYLGSLENTSVRRISDRESAYAFIAPAHLLFARQGALWARKLTPDYGSAEGDLMPVAPNVLVESTFTGFGAFSASPTGSIAYRASARTTQLVWVDRTGRDLQTLGEPDASQMTLWALAPDGRTAAVTRVVDGNEDVWLVDAARGVSRRLTTDPGGDGPPVFSPDASRVVYVSDGEADVYQIHERRADGSGSARLVLASVENKNPNDWSPDGRYVLYTSQSPETGFDIMAVPISGDGKPFEIARTPFPEADGRFSPDGHWVAYMSIESGSPQIFVRPFAGPGTKFQVSVGGGSQPRWRRDGGELFYVAPDNRVMAVRIVTAATRVEAGRPHALFTLSTMSGYEPAPDGKRFLTFKLVSPASPITVILNWKPPRP